MKLEELQPDATVRGILPDAAVNVVSVDWHGSEALTLVYRGPNGRVADEILYRHDEARLELVEAGRPWSFDGDGALFRLVSEAHRIRLAHLFDPVLAVHTSLVDPLPHQITAVYEAMLPRQPLRFLLADDPGAGKTIMAGLLIKELIARGDLRRCLIVCPGSLVEQWQDELNRRFHLPFEILTNDKLEAARTGNWFLENDLAIARLDKLSRNEDVQQKLSAQDCRYDLIVCDEAHKLSATFFSGEAKFTKRYRLGQLLSSLTRHFLLMTATPHNGKEEDFQLFLALLDGDRFEGRFRDGVHQVEVSDIMRRMVKERLLKFDGRPLFPERIAYTAPFELSDGEARLYKEVTDYVRTEFNRAEALQNDKRAGTVGFALTILQRRLASSPEAIFQSLRRRRERLESRLHELELLQRGATVAQPVGNGPQLDAEDVEDLEEAPENEVEEVEEKILDQATAASTISELKAEIGTLSRLENIAGVVRRSGQDTKWRELAQLLQTLFSSATMPKFREEQLPYGAGPLLVAISSLQSEVVRSMKLELRRQVFDQQVRGEKHKAGGSLIEVAAAGGLKPWREVVTPHADVASGRYQQAEFAADLWQVHLGEGSDEYRKPQEFFRRTFLTESLKRMLTGGVQRISGEGGDPVVQLQTNFGGGKTHSMLALYHLFSGVSATELPGVDAVMAESGVKTLPKANRVVLVGNKISPGNPVKKADGTIVRTLWGELAYQLGGKKAFARIKADDEKATSPGDALRELFKEYGPCLILIDEWVAYARQLHDQSDLPAGGFETQFSFAQALTESAKLAGNCLLVISLPASDTAGSPHTQADDVEVGGVRGREALNRLRNVVGRVESSWRPATAEEGFEIVRRRLFEPIPGDQFKSRDITCRAFADLYHSQGAEFPAECRDHEYQKRMQAAYPIHPEIFDQLYGVWSTLVKFQRTRGVLRLMASVIHSLWEKGDRSPMILPSLIPIDDPRVQFELTRYLSDNWVPIIEKDVDGSGALPIKIDGEQPNLGKVSATRRVARTIYLGSAPSAGVAHRGIEDRRVKLGCVIPGESPAVFGDALRRLAGSATYLYQDGNRFWYDTQPTVTKLADDRAEQFKREPDRLMHELDSRLRLDFGIEPKSPQRRGEFERIHPMPKSGADVPDECHARLIVLSADHLHSKEDSAAEAAARAILDSRGNTPRLYRNTLVFLAADKVRMQDLDEALRKFIAWDSILNEKEALNLSPFQVKQAETQRKAADNAVIARLPETYCWLLVPEQLDPKVPTTWQAVRLSGNDALAVRAGKKLTKDELLLTRIGATILRKYLDKVPLWRGDHVAINQVMEDFARYLYLPRIAGPDVLLQAIRDGVALLTWRTDGFAYAESYDESAKRYRGLRAGQTFSINSDDAGLLVKPEVARAQLDAETKAASSPSNPLAPPNTSTASPASLREPGSAPTPLAEKPLPRRYHGTVQLDPTRVGRDASRIADEVIAHLVGQLGANVTVTLDIEADIPAGASEQLVRIVTENSRTLKFKAHGFERD